MCEHLVFQMTGCCEISNRGQEMTVNGSLSGTIEWTLGVYFDPCIVTLVTKSNY